MAQIYGGQKSGPGNRPNPGAGAPRHQASGPFRPPGGAGGAGSGFGSGRSDGNRGGGRGDGAAEIRDVLAIQTGIKLWKDKAAKQINPDMLGADAQRRAEALKHLATTQVRRFFAPVSAFRQRLTTAASDIPASETKAEALRLRAMAAYAAAREKGSADTPKFLGPLEMLRFLVEGGNSIEDGSDFEAFARHFEAVIAFHRVYEVAKEGN